MTGSIRVLWSETDSAVVNIYGPTGAVATGFKVDGNAVTFPYTLSASTTFTTGHIDKYSISVTYYGTEIANTPDGERVVNLGDADELVFAPSPDVGKVMAPANDATLTSLANDTSSNFRGALNAAFARRDQKPFAGMQMVPGKYSMLDGQRFTAAITQTGMVPMWVQRDQTTLLGRSFDKVALGWSTDDGATWTTHGFTFAGGISAIQEMDNGELVVLRNSIPGEKASIYVSTGWADDHATATFTKVRSNIGCQDGTWRPFSLDTFGSMIFANEYGEKVSVDNMARYTHFSDDYGQTWRTIMDWAQFTTGVGAHLHQVRYDPWWDCVFISGGDDVGNLGNYVSFDYATANPTWTRLPIEHQFTTIYPMPSGVLFMSDIGNPNGIWRLNRTSRDNLEGEWALTIDNNVNITWYGGMMYRADHVPGAPLLIACTTGTVAGGARLYATHDGVAFRDVWDDSGQSYLNTGLWTTVGPTVSGKYFGQLSRDADMTAANTFALKLTPGPSPEKFPGVVSRKYRSGLYYQTVVSSSVSVITTGKGTLRLTPWQVDRPITVSSIGVEVVVTGDAGSVFRLGVYGDDGNGFPNDLLLDTTVAADSTGNKEVAVTLTLQPGLYWVGATSQNWTTTEAQVRGFTSASGVTAPVVALTGGSTPSANLPPAFGYAATGLTAALPAVFPASVAPTTSAARVFVKVA